MTKKAIQLTWDKVFNKNGQVYYKIVKKGQKASDKKWKRQKKSSLVIKKNMQAYVLVKVVDSSGNVYKWRTQTFIIDKTKPQIKGVKNQKEYTQKVCVKIKDKQSGISKVLCNGKNITKKLTKKGKITFTKKGIYQLVVVNGCGRKKKITFTMK